jgi:hypothetical protein
VPIEEQHSQALGQHRQRTDRQYERCKSTWDLGELGHGLFGEVVVTVPDRVYKAF